LRLLILDEERLLLLIISIRSRDKGLSLLVGESGVLSLSSTDLGRVLDGDVSDSVSSLDGHEHHGSLLLGLLLLGNIGIFFELVSVDLASNGLVVVAGLEVRVGVAGSNVVVRGIGSLFHCD